MSSEPSETREMRFRSSNTPRNNAKTQGFRSIATRTPCGSGYGVPLTEDLQHGQTFGAVRVVDPFESLDRTPAEVLEVLEQ